MAAPKINENCHYVQNDPHKCKIRLEKFHFDILYCFGVIKESLMLKYQSGNLYYVQFLQFYQDLFTVYSRKLKSMQHAKNYRTSQFKNSFS